MGATHSKGRNLSFSFRGKRRPHHECPTCGRLSHQDVSRPVCNRLFHSVSSVWPSSPKCNGDDFGSDCHTLTVSSCNSTYSPWNTFDSRCSDGGGRACNSVVRTASNRSAMSKSRGKAVPATSQPQASSKARQVSPQRQSSPSKEKAPAVETRPLEKTRTRQKQSLLSRGDADDHASGPRLTSMAFTRRKIPKKSTGEDARPERVRRSSATRGRAGRRSVIENKRGPAIVEEPERRPVNGEAETEVEVESFQNEDYDDIVKDDPEGEPPPIQSQFGPMAKPKGGEDDQKPSKDKDSEHTATKDEDEVEEAVSKSPEGRFLKFNHEIGRGSFKTVFRGLDAETGVDVAWCELMERKWNKQERQRFREEAEMLKGLQHPNIVRFFDYWEVAGPNRCIVLVTELMTSGTLKQYLRRLRKVYPKVLKRWCQQIIKGLNFLHSRSPPIIHRDLKCDNIFITGTMGLVKIGDLGLATLKNRSCAKSVIGTPEFMAPEVYDENYDEGVDVYAFGMCMMEMATLEYPYGECHGPAQIYRKVTAGVRPLSFNKIEDEVLKDFISWCIQIKSANRPKAVDLLYHEFLSEDMGIKVELVDRKLMNQSTSKVITLRLHITDAKKRMDKHDENEAIEFEYQIGKDTPRDVADGMVKTGIIGDDDQENIMKMVQCIVDGLRRERGDDPINEEDENLVSSDATADSMNKGGVIDQTQKAHGKLVQQQPQHQQVQPAPTPQMSVLSQNGGQPTHSHNMQTSQAMHYPGQGDPQAQYSLSNAGVQPTPDHLMYAQQGQNFSNIPQNYTPGHHPVQQQVLAHTQKLAQAQAHQQQLLTQAQQLQNQMQTQQHNLTQPNTQQGPPAPQQHQLNQGPTQQQIQAHLQQMQMPAHPQTPVSQQHQMPQNQLQQQQQQIAASQYQKQQMQQMPVATQQAQMPQQSQAPMHIPAQQPAQVQVSQQQHQQQLMHALQQQQQQQSHHVETQVSQNQQHFQMHQHQAPSTNGQQHVPYHTSLSQPNAQQPYQVYQQPLVPPQQQYHTPISTEHQSLPPSFPQHSEAQNVGMMQTPEQQATSGAQPNGLKDHQSLSKCQRIAEAHHQHQAQMQAQHLANAQASLQEALQNMPKTDQSKTVGHTDAQIQEHRRGSAGCLETSDVVSLAAAAPPEISPMMTSSLPNQASFEKTVEPCASDVPSVAAVMDRGPESGYGTFTSGADGAHRLTMTQVESGGDCVASTVSHAEGGQPTHPMHQTDMAGVVKLTDAYSHLVSDRTEDDLARERRKSMSAAVTSAPPARMSSLPSADDVISLAANHSLKPNVPPPLVSAASESESGDIATDPSTQTKQQQARKRPKKKTVDKFPKFSVIGIKDKTVECQVEAKNLKTVTFTFDITNESPDEVANNLVTNELISKNHWEMFVSMIGQVIENIKNNPNVIPEVTVVEKQAVQRSPSNSIKPAESDPKYVVAVDSVPGTPVKCTETPDRQVAIDRIGLVDDVLRIEDPAPVNVSVSTASVDSSQSFESNVSTTVSNASTAPPSRAGSSAPTPQNYTPENTVTNEIFRQRCLTPQNSTEGTNVGVAPKYALLEKKLKALQENKLAPLVMPNHNDSVCSSLPDTPDQTNFNSDLDHKLSTDTLGDLEKIHHEHSHHTIDNASISLKSRQSELAPMMEQDESSLDSEATETGGIVNGPQEGHAPLTLSLSGIPGQDTQSRGLIEGLARSVSHAAPQETFEELKAKLANLVPGVQVAQLGGIPGASGADGLVTTVLAPSSEGSPAMPEVMPGQEPICDKTVVKDPASEVDKKPSRFQVTKVAEPTATPVTSLSTPVVVKGRFAVTTVSNGSKDSPDTQSPISADITPVSRDVSDSTTCPVDDTPTATSSVGSTPSAGATLPSDDQPSPSVNNVIAHGSSAVQGGPSRKVLPPVPPRHPSNADAKKPSHPIPPPVPPRNSVLKKNSSYDQETRPKLPHGSRVSISFDSDEDHGAHAMPVRQPPHERYFGVPLARAKSMSNVQLLTSQHLHGSSRSHWDLSKGMGSPRRFRSSRSHRGLDSSQDDLVYHTYHPSQVVRRRARPKLNRTPGFQEDVYYTIQGQQGVTSHYQGGDGVPLEAQYQRPLAKNKDDYITSSSGDETIDEEDLYPTPRRSRRRLAPPEDIPGVLAPKAPYFAVPIVSPSGKYSVQVYRNPACDKNTLMHPLRLADEDTVCDDLASDSELLSEEEESWQLLKLRQEEEMAALEQRHRMEQELLRKHTRRRLASRAAEGKCLSTSRRPQSLKLSDSPDLSFPYSPLQASDPEREHLISPVPDGREASTPR